jgi:SAM-dependent methyltransferase
VTAAFEEFCACPDCFAPLSANGTGLNCTRCSTHFEVRNGIAMLLPSTGDAERDRYRTSYEQLARDDLDTPLEGDRDVRHVVLEEFIGDVRGARVLDIGSSHAAYLRRLDAGQKVALDIALPFLQAIDGNGQVTRVCGDAEHLPVARGAFDVIVLSDMLEHVLDPEAVIARLADVCTPSTRVIVHVPWNEDLASYADSEYEFAHLRKFTTYSFAHLFRRFYIRRLRATWPSLEEPIIFKVMDRSPRLVQGLMSFAYFQTGLARWESRKRTRWIAELPRRERWLLRFYDPKFKMFELSLVPPSRREKLLMPFRKPTVR